MSKQKKLGITVKKDEDFSEWYTQLLKECELADLRYNVKGFVVYQPWAAISIRRMYQKLESILDKKGHQPLVMPTVIPESNFNLEAEHVEGFTPEVFWVTHGGENKLEEKLALRPTSETAFYQMYSLWIRSHNQLPFKRYQSGSVFRYEGKATRPFYRGREFHWIETHCAHANEKDALKQVKEDMKTTEEFLTDELGIPFIFFERPQWDKFAGAQKTFAADALMGSGRVLQLPSTHLLGLNFSKPFNVTFKDKDGKEKYAHMTCYGPAISRIYGAMISYLGDDKGLILPFDLAPTQIIIVPILFDKTKDKVLKKCSDVKKMFEKDYDVEIDLDDDKNPGQKFYYWEMKGVPIRIAIGPKDLEKKQVELFRRDIGKKEFVFLTKLKAKVEDISKTFTKNLAKKAKNQFEKNLKDVSNFKDLRKAISQGMIARASFCSIDSDGETCAQKIEKELSAFVRGTKAFADETPKGKCIICSDKAKEVVYIAKSY